MGGSSSKSKKGTEFQMPSARASNKIRIQRSRKENAFVCVSIDFGTTYSGYAFSFKNNPSRILGQHDKTPTVLLLDPHKNMVAFGDKANEQYQELSRLKQHRDWYLFQRFKMALFVRDAPLDKDMEIEDICGKKMKAIEVFTHAIKFIKTDALNKLTNQNLLVDGETIPIITETDIHWIVTVPAIWKDLAKKFMRDAATKAGILDELFTLALEPEAASLYCQEQLGVDKLPTGHRYIVLDIGGGTTDITVHEVNAYGTLSEVYQPTGGAFGGINVDNEFRKVLVQIFGNPLIQKLKWENMEEYLGLMKNFEAKKRTFNGNTRMALQFPTRLGAMYLEDVGERFQTNLRNTLYAGSIDCVADKLVISIELAKNLFKETVDQVVNYTEQILRNVKSIGHIVLVGGFAESPYLQLVMTRKFGNMVVIPKAPSYAVLCGTVMYGHKPRAIAARVCKYTYGIARMMKFKPHHPKEKKVPIAGIDYCDGIFNKHIEIGTPVSLEDAENAKEHEYFPSTSYLRQAVLEVYASPGRNPTYVDDYGCQLVGLIKLDINPQGDINSKLLVKMMFGGTELRIQVTDVKNKTVTNASVDFLA